MSLEELPQENEMPDELAQAFLRLRNGDYIDLELFVEKHGVQEKPYNLDPNSRKRMRLNVEGGMWQIETRGDYEGTLDKWKLFADAGLLTREILEEGIDSAIQDRMSGSEEEVARANKMLAQSHKLTHYSEDFLGSFKKDIIEKVKQKLGWDISLK